MSFNGSGTFLINSTGQPVVANTVISATVFNALTADLASGLTNCITKDGQSTPTANIPMGSNKITGLANGTLINDAATLGQVQSTAAKLIGSISGVDTVLGIMSPTLTAYAAGQLFYYIAAGANTGAVTLNIDGLGAKAVTRDGSTALAAGDINSGEIVVVIYDGTRFQMINAANSFGNTTINGTLTVTGNTGLQANVSITSTLSVGGTFAVTGAATLGSTLAVMGKADLPTVSTASINAAVAVVTTGTVTNLTSTSASIASVNAGVALLTTATVTDLTASSASIASANIGNLQFTAASIASINAGVAVVTNLTATSASIASANVGTAVITTGTVTNLTSTSASIASANAAVALVTTGTVTNLTSTSASIASANLGTAVIGSVTLTGASVASANVGVANVTDLRAVGASITSANVGTAVITTGTVTNLTATGASVASINAGVALVTTGTVTNLTVTSASIASANAGTAVVTNLTATGASIASANVGTGVVTALTVTGASVASANVGTAVITTLTATGASVASINAGVALVTTGTVTNLTSTTASIASANIGVAAIGTLSFTGASIASLNAGTATITTGNLTFSSTGQRITGDFSNATQSNRLMFQSSVANTNTPVNSIPNGTATGAGFRGYGASDPTNAPAVSVFQVGTTDSRISSEINGTASYTPMTFYTGGSERMRLDTSGNLGIGTASPDAKLTVSGGAASFADGTSSAPAIANAGDLDTGVYFPAADEVAVSAGGTVAAAFNSNGLFFRNRIINGDMRIDQRNAGAAVTTGGSYPVDRFPVTNTSDGAFSAQQDSSAPTGFVNSVKFTTTTADATLTTFQNLNFTQVIEGTNVADLAWGTANARTITLSFWVRSSLTGTFGGSLRNNGALRSYPFTYSISVADTWEYKTVTIPGDTSGTWLTTTGVGLYVTFGLGAGPDRSGTAGAWAGANYVSATGAVSVIGTLNATWYVTGVQLETGSVATPFERRPYGTELMLCQRYYYRLKSTGANYPFGFAQCYSTTSAGALIPYPVTMRTAPSALEQSGTATDYQLYQAGGGVQACSAVPAYAGVLTTTAYGAVNFTVAANIVAGNITQATGANSSAYLGWSAEL